MPERCGPDEAADSSLTPDEEGGLAEGLAELDAGEVVDLADLIQALRRPIERQGQARPDQ